MTLTIATVHANVRLASGLTGDYARTAEQFRADYAHAMHEGFNWRGVSGAARIPGNIRRLFRTDLAARQGFICLECGGELDTTHPDVKSGEYPELCHVVTRGLAARTSDEGRGWLPGNIMVCHKRCNYAQRDRGPVVMPHTLARPDLFSMEWETFPNLRRLRNS